MSIPDAFKDLEALLLLPGKLQTNLQKYSEELAAYKEAATKQDGLACDLHRARLHDLLDQHLDLHGTAEALRRRVSGG